MRRIVVLTAAAGLLLVAPGRPVADQARTRPMEKGVTGPGLSIPESIRTEHEAIHASLVEATRAAGPVGAAAKELAGVLHPHFVREEEIALPPLGLLAPLAAGETLAEKVAADALAMTDTLRSELPRMLEEHTRIRAAVGKLRSAARAAQAAGAERLAEELALHALTEEQVLYPAAVLVGDVIRARQRGRPATGG